MAIERIAVFCGSNPGNDDAFTKAAISLANEMISRGIELVYGGGSVGLMGVIADQMLANGGKVIGVIPKHLMDRELGHQGITDMYVVSGMHQRKSMMMELSDAFIAMPGGVGTLEEIFEVFTWNKIGIHSKPCAVLNVNGFYNKLIDFLEHTVNAQFLRQAAFDSLIIKDDPAEILAQIERSVD